MYLGVDVGATKTLVATLDNNGVITEKVKFPTAADYDDFLVDLEKTISQLKVQDFRAAGIGIPAARIDRNSGTGIIYSNLSWENTPVVHDVERICRCPLALENDAKLAALSEAMLLKDRFKLVLYITISTGIGFGLVKNGVIDTTIGDGGGRTILLDHQGKMTPWEDFASGKAITKLYGKHAKDINDEATWQKISRDLAEGIIELIAIAQPEVIVFGGSVGAYFPRYQKFLKQAIEKYKVPLVKLPLLMEAQRPNDAVVYGCYDLAKQVYGHESVNS